MRLESARGKFEATHIGRAGHVVLTRPAPRRRDGPICIGGYVIAEIPGEGPSEGPDCPRVRVRDVSETGPVCGAATGQPPP